MAQRFKVGQKVKAIGLQGKMHSQAEVRLAKMVGAGDALNGQWKDHIAHLGMTGKVTNINKEEPYRGTGYTVEFGVGDPPRSTYWTKATPSASDCLEKISE